MKYFRCFNFSPPICIEFKTEFIQLIATQASDICENEARKTITPGHVLAALKELGFEDHLEKVSDELGKCKDLVRASKIVTQHM